MTHSRQYSWREGQLGLESVPLSMTLSPRLSVLIPPHLGSTGSGKCRREWGTRSDVHGAVKLRHMKGVAEVQGPDRPSPSFLQDTWVAMPGEAAEFASPPLAPGNLGSTA